MARLRFPRQLLLAICFVSVTTTPAWSQVRCGQPMQAKTEVERTPRGFETATFLDRARGAFDGRFKGYALIITDGDGRRLGFRREGWSVDPCESGTAGTPFTLDTESAIGSVTKLLTTVAVVKAAGAPYRYTLPITTFLPHRWRERAHPYYDTVTIADLLRHQAGFRRSGGGEHVASRLSKGRELATPAGSRSYSNSSMGIFHFIYAKYAFRGALHSQEVALQNASDSEYDRVIQDETSRLFNLGLYRQVLDPLGISATCNPNLARFPAGQPSYHPFFDVARSYSSPSDDRGMLLDDTTRNCASGGLYMSAKDLARFMSGLRDPAFLAPQDRARMMNHGPADDLMGFWATGGTEGGRSFSHTGLRDQNGHVSHAAVIQFPYGLHAVFVANSPPAGVDVVQTLIAAFNDASTRPPRTAPDRPRRQS